MDHTLHAVESSAARGKAVAIAGLVIQCLLASGMAALTVWSGSQDLVAATWHMLGGIPIWLILAIIYGQQEIERRETLAIDKLARDDSAALFGELPDELHRARQRLQTIIAYGLPATSFIVGGSLVGIGGLLLWRAITGWGNVATLPGLGAWSVGMMFASGGIAFVAFVAGRWMSGCARVPGWQLLRGGASYLMSCFVVAALMLAASVAVALSGDISFLRLVAFAVPIVMVTVGGEILVASLLEAYRPRRPGELLRPAFDSRLLGLLTAPESLGDVLGDLIRYQFGVDVSGSWLSRLLARSLLPLSLAGAAVLLALSCVVVVGPDEQAVVLRWGAAQGMPRGPGIRFKLPWPIETAETHLTGRVLRLTASSSAGDRETDGDALLWRTADDRLEQIGKEYYPTVLATSADGGGLAVLQAEVVVEYRIRDLIDFLATATQPETILRVIVQQETSRFFASRDVPFLMARGRSDGGATLATAIQARADTLDLGITIVDASLTSIRPPGGSVARAFHRQIAAQQERETVVEKARRDAVAILAQVAGSVEQSRLLDTAILALDDLRTQADGARESPETDARVAAQLSAIDALLNAARGDAARLIHAARGSRWSRISVEQAARERFVGELEAHARAPRYYQAERLFAVLADALANRRKFVVTGDDGQLPVLRMDFADPTSAIDTLLGE